MEERIMALLKEMSICSKRYFDCVVKNLKYHKVDEDIMYNVRNKLAGLSPDEVVQSFVGSMFEMEKKHEMNRVKLREAELEIERLKRELNCFYASKYTKQKIKVKAGRPIALKGKYSDVLELEQKGYTDEMILQTLGISRSTLWRYRKEYKDCLDKE